MKPEEIIKKKIQEIAQNIGDFDFTDPSVDYADNVDFGDLSTNFALVNYSKVNKEFANPREFALHILTKIEADRQIKQYFDKVTVDGPGFINFKFSTGYLQKQVGEIITKGQNYGSSEFGRGKKVLVEFVSANPTGPLHMGNIRGGPIGDVLSNVLQKAGFEVDREYYINDVGHQIEVLVGSLAGYYHMKTKGSDKVKHLLAHQPEAYVGPYYEEEALEIGKLYEKEKEKGISVPITSYFEKMFLKRSIDGIKKDLEDLGIKFNNWVYESQIRDEFTSDVVKNLKSVKEKEGAIWFAQNDNFLKDRESVLVKSDGSYTYFANDIVYHKNKFDRGFDVLIDVWGANHHGHVSRMKAAVVALGHDPDSFQVILYQWVSLIKNGERVSMSKRKGEFVTAREVINEIGSDAMRFLLLTSASDSHIQLDLDLAKAQKNENPVFYVQYAYARISSIFRKADQDFDAKKANLDLIKEPSEIALIRNLIRFPELVREIAKDFGVNRLTTYSITIADLFHKFYESCRVISDNQELSGARLALVKSTQIVLKNTLDILGVSAPERM